MSEEKRREHSGFFDSFIVHGGIVQCQTKISLDFMTECYLRPSGALLVSLLIFEFIALPQI